MSKTLFLLHLVMVISLQFVGRSSATVYTVGDSAGWDISTDLDSWVKGKTFAVGDALLFQYSSYHSLSELTKSNYEDCNTTVPLQSYTGGNTSVPLTEAGNRYFACGNKLHCLGGMKLKVHVDSNQAPSPAPAAQQGGSLPNTSKTNNPSTSVQSSSSVALPNLPIAPLLLLLLFKFYLVR
ncbi:hypothetical protein Nepgr_030430 [Nepenthes gracilis]|uniref:Phytocyanin domain-containing protein n=1 Tax=Nepenthes gracilis TaxID=150966 RepID=A0AAD3Y3V7_NEPGR|nr:hypothetical protein Nepgr_030430 [Nepenthes gracilis]